MVVVVEASGSMAVEDYQEALLMEAVVVVVGVIARQDIGGTTCQETLCSTP